jgi:hypothetical protein
MSAEPTTSPVASGASPQEALQRLHLALSVAMLANDSVMDERLIHPDLVVPSVPGVAPADGFRGIEGLRRYFRDAEAHGFLAQAAISTATVTAAGNVLAGGELLCTAAGSTDAFPAWFVYRFRDKRVSAIETYLDEREAMLAAAS